MRRPHARFLWLVAAVVLANYAAQIPYVLRLGKTPTVSGSLLLGATLVWFLCGYAGLLLGWRLGYFALLSFLLTEVGFYSWNVLNQVRHGYPPFMHLQERDPILWAVFAIGYVNMLAGVACIVYLLRHRRTLLSRGLSPRARPA